MEQNMQFELNLEVETFDLIKTLECGQCFRWNKVGQDNSYIGVIKDRVLKVKQVDNMLYVCSSNYDNLENVVKEYFDLCSDYTKFENKLKKYDQHLKTALSYSSGTHILNQPLFEMIISYIISANNNIPRIKKSVEQIAKKVGKKIQFEGKEYYLFPTVDEAKKLIMDDLLECGTGFRARYLLKDIANLDDKTLKAIYAMDTQEAYKFLINMQGIGPKVADCILLFAKHKMEVFPVDTWIKRVMEKIYYGKNTDLKIIRKQAMERFGSLAGLAQQHLFINVRDGNI